MKMPKGIPTIYDGVRFRSRLEARWAMFFDRLGWKWSYEQVECSGWIPDFSLAASDGDRVLVEIKPLQFTSTTLAEGEMTREYRDKIDRCDQEHQILLLGEGPFYDDSHYRDEYLGMLRTPSGYYEPLVDAFVPCMEWEPAAFSTCEGIGFHGAYGAYDNVITGGYDGNTGTFQNINAVRHWRYVSNYSQWKGANYNAR